MKNKPQIIFKDVKHANIKIKPTGEVILTVPLKTPKQKIDTILKNRSSWIEKHLEFFSKNLPKKEEFKNGDTFSYLGKKYSLKLIETNKSQDAKLGDGCFNLYITNKNDYNEKYRLIESWYKSKAEKHFQDAIDKYLPIVNKKVFLVRIKTMKTRWGSCNPKKGYINLNLELIKKPKTAIEYVVFHELTHLIHYNHDRNFYDYLSLHMPDWRKRKETLEKYTVC